MTQSVKPQKLTQVNFVEGQNSDQIPFQLGKPCRKVDFCINGTIDITDQAGTIVPVMGPAADGTVIFPYLLFLAGKLNFFGTRKDAGKGLKINNIPIWLIWFENYLTNKGVGPVVSDGGMQGASFAAGTYTVSIGFTLNFFDPMTPADQHGFTYFRPVCYNSQPYFQIEGGYLYDGGPNFEPRNDNVALTSESTTSPVLDYTLDLTINASAFLVPNFKMAASDQCADMSYEYIGQFDANQSQYNNNNLADLEVQAYIYLFNTDWAEANGAGTNYIEKGSDTLGNANNTIIETDIGTDPIAQVYSANLKSEDYNEFMSSVSAIPDGVRVIDEYGHNWAQWQTKTFLQPGIPQHLVQGNGVPNGSGSNFRILHKSYNLSASAKKKQGTFPRFAGA